MTCSISSGFSKRASRKMTDDEHEIDWSVTTWEGNRRAQLRRSLELSLRERLQALDEMAKLADALLRARTDGKLRSPGSPGYTNNNTEGSAGKDDSVQ